MNMQVMTDKGVKDVSILDVTPQNFIVPKGEEDSYHCRIEIKKFNGETGERLSRPQIQVFGKKFFESFGLHNLKKQGYTVDILHDPNEWSKKQAIAKAEAEEKAKAEAEAKKQAETIAELKANGISTTGKKK